MTNPSTCDHCCSRSSVQDSRVNDDCRMRRHKCPKCNMRWSTVEIKIGDKSYKHLVEFITWILNGPADQVEALIKLVRAWQK